LEMYTGSKPNLYAAAVALAGGPNSVARARRRSALQVLSPESR
jgi:hypothetical protein